MSFWVFCFLFFCTLGFYGGVPPIKSFNPIGFLLSVHFEIWRVFSFWVFGVWRNERHHKSGRSRFIPVRVRIQRARASNFDFEWVFRFCFFFVCLLQSITNPEKIQKLKNYVNRKVWSKNSLNTNPYGDKSTTARFVVSLIPSYAKS